MLMHDLVSTIISRQWNYSLIHASHHNTTRVLELWTFRYDIFSVNLRFWFLMKILLEIRLRNHTKPWVYTFGIISIYFTCLIIPKNGQIWRRCIWRRWQKSNTFFPTNEIFIIKYLIVIWRRRKFEWFL